MNFRCFTTMLLSSCLLLTSAVADDGNLSLQLMRSTFKITNGQTNGTAFILSRRIESEQPQTILITAAHVLEIMKGEDATLILRRPSANDSFEKVNHPLRIRKGDKVLWTKHPTQDVAAMEVSLPKDITLPRLTSDLLATDDMLKQNDVQPGDLLRCIGFPHAGQFEANAAGFPLVRIGCLASYPLLPTKQTKTFVMDFNTFEGDSGAAVYLELPAKTTNGKENTQPVRLIVGIIHGQHFIDEKFQMIYQSGMTRHRLGLGIVTHATAVRETLDLLEKENR